MPLQGFLRTSDPSHISSITAGTKIKRKKLIVPQSLSKSSEIETILRDCQDHSSPHPTIPVELMQLKDGVGFESVGIAKCCPLCWYILEFPVGFNPPRQEQKPSKKPVSSQQKVALRNGRRRARTQHQTGPRSSTQMKFERILGMVEVETITAYDVMDALHISRTMARKLLETMVDSGTIIAERAGVGRGKQVYYTKTP